MNHGQRRALSDLADKQAISEVIYRYCRGLDRLDAAMLATVYHHDAQEDRGAGIYVGSAHGMAPVALRHLALNFSSSQHFIGNILIELRGVTAFVESYFQAYHRYADRPGTPATEVMMAGRYLDRFERRAGEWRIAHRRMDMDWTRTQQVQESWMDRHPGAHRGDRSPAGARL